MELRAGTTGSDCEARAIACRSYAPVAATALAAEDGRLSPDEQLAHGAQGHAALVGGIESMFANIGANDLMSVEEIDSVIGILGDGNSIPRQALDDLLANK